MTICLFVFASSFVQNRVNGGYGDYWADFQMCFNDPFKPCVDGCFEMYDSAMPLFQRVGARGYVLLALKACNRDCERQFEACMTRAQRDDDQSPTSADNVPPHVPGRIGF